MGVQSIGTPVRREEDLRLLKGKGRYVDDVRATTEAHGYVLRSPHAHARIAATRCSAGDVGARRASGVDRRRSRRTRPRHAEARGAAAGAATARRPLSARSRSLRAIVSAMSAIRSRSSSPRALNQAKDAAELIDIDYEPLPAVLAAEAALAPGAPAVWDDNPGNEAFFHEAGDKAAVDAAFARAAHIVRHKTVINRVTANTMEPRGCLADVRPGRGSLHDPLHGPVGRTARARRSPAGSSRLPHHQFRVVCDNMGGGFGMKGGCYPEYALSLWARRSPAARCAGSPSAAKGC